MKQYTVAMVVDSEGFYHSEHWMIDNDALLNEAYLNNHNVGRKVAFLSEYGGCKVVAFLQTKSIGLYLQNRVKCECAELKNMVEKHNDFLVRLENEGASEELRHETYEQCLVVQELKINRIGGLLERMYNNNLRTGEEREVWDDLVYECNNYYMRKKQMKRSKQLLDRELNHRYHMSRMNAYC